MKKRFKDFLKKLQEDKLLTKEDEGIPGDVSAPGSSSPTSDIVSGKAPNGSVRYDDIVGHCDHKKDGFFGPGCMHRPFPVFSYPVSRIKRKKKKYIKVLDLTESEEYSDFNNTAKNILEELISEANHKFKDTGIGFYFDKDYDFDDGKENWVGALNGESGEENQYGIAFNLPVIYQFLEENSLENDETELKCQLKATLYHEIAHAILKYMRDEDILNLDLNEGEEEEYAEEYARYQMREFTGQTSSRLEELIKQSFRK